MEAEVVYFDATDVFSQLGIVPPRASRREPALQLAHRVRMRAAPGPVGRRI